MRSVERNVVICRRPLAGPIARCAVRSMHDATISVKRTRGSRQSPKPRKLLPEPFTHGSIRNSDTISVCSRFRRTGRLTLGLIYLQTSATVHVDNLSYPTCSGKFLRARLSSASWPGVRARAAEPARAEAETRRQTTLLIQEIDAHSVPTPSCSAPRKSPNPQSRQERCRRLSHELRRR